MTRHTLLALLVGLPVALAVLVSGVSGAVGALPQTSQDAQTALESMTVTVYMVDTNARTLDVITGIGHALRLLKVQVDPQCEIRVAGAGAHLGDLKAGHIVRIQYRKLSRGSVAEKIDTVAPEATEGKR